MEEKVTYQVGVNIVGINEYLEHSIPVEDVNSENAENVDIEKEYDSESDMDEDIEN